MAIDIKARLKELREKKELEAKALETQNANAKKEKVKDPEQTTTVQASVQDTSPPEKPNLPVVTNNTTVGTTRTSEIDHLAFMSNLQELQDAIHTQHPKMPVLLMMIHKHLRTDPELVTTLSEEEIGTIVNGLKIQTKTELAGTVLKAPSSRAKKIALSTDMF